MNGSIKLLTIATFAYFTLGTVQLTHAQTLAKNEAWLEKQFGKLITEDDGDTPKFTFKGCQMKMAVDSKDKDVSVGMNMAWQLRDIQKVGYKKDKDGQYTLILDVPADKVKMAMNVGGFSGSFNADDKDKSSKDNKTNLSLDTKDETLVRQIKQKLEESVQLCRQGKN